MKYEIERKYIVKKSILKKFLFKSGLEYKKSKITQNYIEIKPNFEVRVRQMDTVFTLTSKSGEGIKRAENESIISKKEYKKRVKNSIGREIKKNRYLFYIDGNEYAIDLYKKSLFPLVVMEVEFEKEENLNKFSIPSQILRYVVKDVSEDKRFKNHCLSLIGIPQTTAKESLRGIFKHFCQNIKSCKTKVLTEFLEEDLHQFRITLRRSRVILSEFKEFFPKYTYQNAKDNLKVIVQITNRKRDLDVFYDSIKKETELVKFIEYIERQREYHKKVIDEFFKKGDFDYLMDELEELIESDKFYKKKAINEQIKDSLTQKLNSKRDLIKNSLTNLKKETTIKELHSIRIEFKKLRYLLESFEFLTRNKQMRKFLKESRWYQNRFGELNDLAIQKEIIDDYLKESSDEKEILQKRVKLMNQEIDRLRDKIIKKGYR